MSVAKALLFSNDGSEEFCAFFSLDFMTDYHFNTDAERLQVLFLLDRVCHRAANNGHDVRRHNPLLAPFGRFAKACLDAFRRGSSVLFVHSLEHPEHQEPTAQRPLHVF